MTTNRPPPHGVRIVEVSMLGPAAITTHLADLGAEVIKVEYDEETVERLRARRPRLSDAAVGTITAVGWG